MYLVFMIPLPVATVLTACGIETQSQVRTTFLRRVATVLTACGIETLPLWLKI